VWVTKFDTHIKLQTNIKCIKLWTFYFLFRVTYSYAKMEPKSFLSCKNSGP
jgi:hypothetical protein